MQKVFLFLLLFLLPLAEVPNHAPASEPVSVASTPETDEIDQLFDDMQLDGIVSYTAFRQAVTGYQKIEQKSKSIMTLIDFSKPSAAYANPIITASAGRLGRSLGCPALPQALAKPIIDTIKKGSVLFIYANNKDYLANSTFLSPRQTEYLSWAQPAN